MCVIEKLDVRSDFRTALFAALEGRKFSVRSVPKGSATDECEYALAYDAKYSWDFKPYLAWAEVIAYRKGARVGDALYSAPTGGWSMTTRIYESTESKVTTMIRQLFPDE